MSIQHHFSDILRELGLTLTQISEAQAQQLAEAIIAAGRIFVVGAGRSELAVKGFAMRLMQLGLQAHVVGETTTPNISQDDLLLIGSGSGSTASLVIIAQKAQAVGAKIALITIRNNSPLAERADIVLTIPAPSSKIGEAIDFQSVQPMASLFEQSLSLTLDALIMMLMSITRTDTGAMFARHANLE